MRVLLAIALGLVVAGCGATRVEVETRTRTVTTTRTVTVAVSPFVAANLGYCELYDDGTAQMLTVSGRGASDVCSAIARKWSNGLTFWSFRGTTARDDVLVCAMRLEGVEVDVYDDGGHTGGTQSCGTLQARGWAQVG